MYCWCYPTPHDNDNNLQVQLSCRPVCFRGISHHITRYPEPRNQPPFCHRQCRCHTFATDTRIHSFSSQRQSGRNCFVALFAPDEHTTTSRAHRGLFVEWSSFAKGQLRRKKNLDISCGSGSHLLTSSFIFFSQKLWTGDYPGNRIDLDIKIATFWFASSDWCAGKHFMDILGYQAQRWRERFLAIHTIKRLTARKSISAAQNDST
jgi:hypothetical protein